MRARSLPVVRLHGPLSKRRTRGGDRLVDIGGVAFCDFGDHPPRAWIEGLERLARNGVDPFAADKGLVLSGEKLASSLH